MLFVERRRVAGVVLLLVLVGLLFSGCSRKPRTHWWELWRKPKEPTASIYPEESTLPPPPDVAKPAPEGEVSPLPLEGQKVIPTPDLGIPEPKPLRIEPQKPVSELQTVYFAFDSAGLSDGTKATLDANADWLLNHPGIHVLIEGHCDERGTVEYNLNLGQRRSDSVREYLVSKGIDSNTLHTISYGEERPLVEGHDEAAWAQNRRVQFLVY